MRYSDHLSPILPLRADAIRVVIRHDVRRRFRLLALLEWLAWLLVLVLTLPFVLWTLIASLFVEDTSPDGTRSSREPGAGAAEPLDRPKESFSRFFHYHHRLTVEVIGQDGSVIARVEHEKVDRRLAEALVAEVITVARRAGLFVEEQTAIGGWLRASQWNPRYAWGYQDLGPVDAAEKRLRAARFELSPGPDEHTISQRIPAPPLSVFLDACALVLLIGLIVGLAAVAATPLSLLGTVPIVTLWFLVRPMRTTPPERSPSVVQSMLRLGGVHRLSFDGEEVRYRARRGLRWRRERFALSELVAVEAAPSLSYGRHAHWVQPRIRFVLSDRTVWLDPEFGGTAQRDVVDWFVHALTRPEQAEAGGRTTKEGALP